MVLACPVKYEPASQPSPLRPENLWGAATLAEPFKSGSSLRGSRTSSCCSACVRAPVMGVVHAIQHNSGNHKFHATMHNLHQFVIGLGFTRATGIWGGISTTPGRNIDISDLHGPSTTSHRCRGY